MLSFALLSIGSPDPYYKKVRYLVGIYFQPPMRVSAGTDLPKPSAGYGTAKGITRRIFY
jgi:uncharacterized protein with NRDE domain